MSKPIVKRILRYGTKQTMLSVGSIFPKDWNYIIVKVIEKSDDKIVVEFKRINGWLESAINGKAESSEST